MDISGKLLCLFSAKVEERSDSYTIEIPKQEITIGAIDPGEGYRMAIFSTKQDANVEEHATPTPPRPDEEPGRRTEGASDPPVEEGEIREVEIEDIGDQGDGITRVERGFVVIVPETEQGERVTVEITDVQSNVAFGEVKERQTHF